MRRLPSWKGFRVRTVRQVALLGLLLAPLCSNARASQSYHPRNDASRIQRLVDRIRHALALDHNVTVEIVASNPLLASVEPVAGHAGAFRLLLEDAFIDQLNDEELHAVVAHELGHVWVFTHHPYLQTELLANQIAMRVVSRDTLQRVYSKVWARGGAKGDLVQFLGND